MARHYPRTPAGSSYLEVARWRDRKIEELRNRLFASPAYRRATVPQRMTMYCRAGIAARCAAAKLSN